MSLQKKFQNWETDKAALETFSAPIEGSMRLFVDANQSWSLPEALDMVRRLTDFAPGFIEEPMRADAAMEAWRELTEASIIPLAAGENITSIEAFARFVNAGCLAVVQPDVAKMGRRQRGDGDWPECD